MTRTRATARPGLRSGTGLLFVVAAGTCAHLLFSWMGFNPTDEGFILAASRRLLDGQVPHRDFISIRPAGPYLTYLPVVWLGGDYTIWLSRWVAWLQFSSMSWCWVATFYRLLTLRLRPALQIALAGSAMALSVHDYPIMAWHTFDAIWLSALGISQVVRPEPGRRIAGYAALGASCLARQNFAPLVVGTLVLLGDWRRPLFILAALAPALTAACVLIALGAGPDAATQLFATHQLLGRLGFERYFVHPTLPLALVGGYAGMAFLCGDLESRRPRGVAAPGQVLAAAGCAAVACWAAIAQWSTGFGPNQSFTLTGLAAGGLACLGAGLGRPARVLAGGAVLCLFSFALFIGLTGAFQSAGILIGLLALWPLIARRFPDPSPAPLALAPRRRLSLAGALALLTGWCVSLSYGSNDPSLVAGVIAALLLMWPLAILRSRTALQRTIEGLRLAILVQAAVCVALFSVVRCRSIYREQPAWRLNRPLGGLLAGGRLIRTNPFTAAVLEDLNSAVAAVAPNAVAIVPDMAAYWVMSARPNPLPIDWPEGFTLGPPALFGRVTAAMRSGSPPPVILVQKVCAECLMWGFEPVPRSVFHRMAPWVQEHFHKIGETRFFELYH